MVNLCDIAAIYLGSTEIERVYKGDVLVWPCDQIEIGTYEYTGSCFDVELAPGTYLFEAWGARGGYRTWSDPDEPGLGGHAKGSVTLTETTSVRVCVGGKGNDGGDGGFNGGGDPHGVYGGGGGGATDFRIGGTGLSDRVLVAGGGGGSTSGYGGDGGGLNGNDGEGSGGEGGTQGAGGSPNGDFGLGGSHDFSVTGNFVAGGGSGWYGGGAGKGGGGGSSYIGGVDDGETETGVRDGHGRAKIFRVYT